MNRKYYHYIFTLSAIVILTFMSCSKEDQPKPNKTPYICQDPACAVPNQDTSKLFTYYMDANQWKGQGPFGCDIGQELKAAAGGYHNITSILVYYNQFSYTLENGKSIDFLQGKLSLSGSYLTFSANYNQLPFQSLRIAVTVN